MIVFITFPWNNVATIFRHNHELIILFNSQRYKKTNYVLFRKLYRCTNDIPFLSLKNFIYIWKKIDFTRKCNTRNNRSKLNIPYSYKQLNMFLDFLFILKRNQVKTILLQFYREIVWERSYSV